MIASMYPVAAINTRMIRPYSIRNAPFQGQDLTAYRWRDSACAYLTTVPRLIQSVMQIDGA